MYLWLIDKQLEDLAKALEQGCDLLSKCIFGLLINNVKYSIMESASVVICFQNVSLAY